MDGLELSSSSFAAAKSPSPDPHSDGAEEERDGPAELGREIVSSAKFSFSSPMDNLVVRGYQFSVT